jgi:hypothetical protein
MQAAQGGAPEAPVYAHQGGSLQRIKWCSLKHILRGL